jgi:hypothetical protein
MLNPKSGPTDLLNKNNIVTQMLKRPGWPFVLRYTPMMSEAGTERGRSSRLDTNASGRSAG